jgi:hypothetical protein
MAHSVVVCSHCDSGLPALRIVGNKGFCGAVSCKAAAFLAAEKESVVTSIKHDFDNQEGRRKWNEEMWNRGM